MLFILFLASAPAEQARPALAFAQAKISVRILEAKPASREWREQDGTAHKRVVLIREADGRVTRLRLIEHE